MPGTHVDPGARARSSAPDAPTADAEPPDEHEPRPARGPDVRRHLPVAGARAADAGLDRLPKVAFDYLQLVGPAVLAALAAVSVMVVVGDDDVPAFHVGIEWVPVFVCLAIVARRRNLFLGLVAAVAIVAIARAAGLAALPA